MTCCGRGLQKSRCGNGDRGREESPLRVRLSNSVKVFHSKAI